MSRPAHQRKTASSSRSFVQRLQVGLDPGPQLVGSRRVQDRTSTIPTGADLRHDPQAGRVRVQRVSDQLVDDVGSVELRRVDVVDAELDGAAEHSSCGASVRRRSEDAGAGQLHRAEPHPVDGVRTEASGLWDGR
jgi:hypothetical protein